MTFLYKCGSQSTGKPKHLDFSLVTTLITANIY